VTTHKKSGVLLSLTKAFCSQHNKSNPIGYHSPVSYESLYSTQIHSLAVVFALGHFPPGSVIVAPLEAREIVFIIERQAHNFKKKRGGGKEKVEGALLKFSFFQNVCFCCLKFSLVAVNKVFLCGAGAGARRHAVCTGSSCSQVQNPQTHSKEDKVSFCSPT